MRAWPGPNWTPSRPAGPARTGGYLSVRGLKSPRRVPGPGALARRRWLITAAKFALPVIALLLLSTIALWPEIENAKEKTRRVMSAQGTAVEGVRVRDARYNGMDDRGRPFTVTAATAVQHGAERVDLTAPNGDMTLENGTWINVHSRDGVFMRTSQQLDLSGDVVMYRDDGTTMTTASVAVDIKAGAASGAEPTHVEGPFGTLDGAGFITLDKGAAIQFSGPVHVELNGLTK